MSNDIPFVCFVWVLRLSLPQAIHFFFPLGAYVAVNPNIDMLL